MSCTQKNLSQVQLCGYYPHIDGIRALAVIPVVLFHVLAALCPGGFAGVDVFFVISGYLITGGILRDLANDRFTIRNFYYRRIRRIMPAYFAMIAGVFAVGCALYYAAPLILLGDAVTAGTLFLANLHFWMLGGDYFAPNLHSQALLHLWSLSVEEQFYLFIPLLCAIIWKFRRSMVAPVLALLAFLSLAGAIYAVLHGKQNNAFYFLHFRAWELLAGSLLAMLPATTYTVAENISQHSQTTSNPVFSQTQTFKQFLLAPLGLLLVLIPYVGISSKTPFPGLAALPSVIGTALLIRYGQWGWVSRLLASRPLVATGKISYSLYLWHWPVTVFWKYAVYDQLCAYDYVGMFLFSVLLGYLSWKYVETPVRTSTFWTLRRSFAFAVMGMVVLVTLGTACVYCKGWSTTLHPTANTLAIASGRDPFLAARMTAITRRLLSRLGRQYIPNKTAVRFFWGDNATTSIGLPGSPELLLIGDSHAGALQYGLDVALRDSGHSGYVISRSATRMFDLSNPEVQKALMTVKANPTIGIVVLSQYWSYSESVRAAGIAESVCEKLEKFALQIKAMNIKMYIVTDNPVRDFSPGDIAAKLKIISPRRIEPKWDGRQSKTEYDVKQGKVNRQLAEVCQKTGSTLIPLHLGLLEGAGYPAYVEQNNQVFPLYRDENHLSPYGARQVAQFIIPLLFSETRLSH